MTQLVAHEVVMPRLTDSMDEGTVVKWLKRVGDHVARGEPLVEIETDKATMRFESDARGTLAEILVEEGDTVAIGTVIARLGDTHGAPQPAPSLDANGRSNGDGAPRAVCGSLRVAVSPVARRVARELRVDLDAVTGSGPRGRIVKADVERAAKAADSERDNAAGRPATRARTQSPPPGARGESELVALSQAQETVTRRMAESKATIPNFSVIADVDMAEATALRSRLKGLADGKPAPSFNDLVIKAVALSLRDFPRVNASYEAGSFRLHSRINIGMSVAGDGVLVVPTIFDADQKSLGHIARESLRLAERVRDGSVTPPELAGATFTVSNLGTYGIDAFTPVINVPQVALLAIGRLARKAVVDESGGVVAREQMTATLVADHRVLYGADAAAFVTRVRTYLERPLLLAL